MAIWVGSNNTESTKRPPTKEEAFMATYDVTVSRVNTQTGYLKVVAANEEAAEKEALRLAEEDSPEITWEDDPDTAELQDIEETDEEDELDEEEEESESESEEE